MGKEKTIYGQCALCRQNKELQLSHIVPHFVGRKMIKTAPGNIRVTNEPNKVAQEKNIICCAMTARNYSVQRSVGLQAIFLIRGKIISNKNSVMMRI